MVLQEAITYFAWNILLNEIDEPTIFQRVVGMTGRA